MVWRLLLSKTVDGYPGQQGALVNSRRQYGHESTQSLVFRRVVNAQHRYGQLGFSIHGLTMGIKSSGMPVMLGVLSANPMISFISLNEICD